MKLRIRDILRQKKLSQIWLADQLGISRSGVIQIMDGNPTIETLQKIANALEVTVPELFAPQGGNNFTALIDNNGELRRFNSAEDLKLFLENI